MSEQGKVYIDNADVFSTYGAMLADGCYQSILAWPAAKTPEMNDWAEYDGVEIDFATYHLNTRTVTLVFWFDGEGDPDAFITLLETDAAHTFKFGTLGDRTWDLRFVGVTAQAQADYLLKLTFTFSDDTPTVSGTPSATMTYYESGYTLNCVNGSTTYSNDLADFDCRTLYGTDLFTHKGDIKQNVLYQSKYEDGAAYAENSGQSRKKTTDGTIRLLLRSTSISALLNNYYALLKACYQTRTIDHEGKRYSAVYKSQSVTKYIAPDWLEFAVTFTLTGEVTDIE